MSLLHSNEKSSSVCVFDERCWFLAVRQILNMTHLTYVRRMTGRSMVGLKYSVEKYGSISKPRILKFFIKIKSFFVKLKSYE